METWQDELYQKTFDAEMRGIQRRIEHDKNCTAETFQGMLQQLYEMDGSDWLGRGEVASITLHAQIDAYETTVVRLRQQ
jgi:hypothetical protein